MITKFTILGERCSGTNFLENCMLQNFNIDVTWEYGWKHFYGFNNYYNSDNVLFIGIVRDIHTWINSLYRTPHHLKYKCRKNKDEFLSCEFVSIEKVKNKWKEIEEDKHIFKKTNYNNIFHARYVKLNYLKNYFPKLVKNFIFIKYEDLCNDFINIMNKINNFGLEKKLKIYIKPTNYKKKNIKYVENKNIIIKKKNIDKCPYFIKKYKKLEIELGYL